MSRGDLTEAEWRVLKNLLPIEPENRGRGRPPEQNRQIPAHDSIDSTTVRAHVSAAGGKGGLIDALLAARGAGSPVSFTAWLMPSDDRSPSI